MSNQFQNLKIEDKLMQKHISSLVKLDQLKRNMEHEEDRIMTYRPSLTSKTIKIATSKMSKHLLFLL